MPDPPEDVNPPRDTAELVESRRLLVRARELERRRLATLLAGVTSDRLTTLRGALAGAAVALSGASGTALSGASGTVAQEALTRARLDLDELLDRFRTIARGVHSTVLRDHGPFAALDELVTEMPRSVLLTGGLPSRLAWEIESGLYHPAAAAVSDLAGRPAAGQLRVHLANADGRMTVRITDAAPERPARQVCAGLRDEAERLVALGGDLVVTDDDGVVVVEVWMPDRLESGPGSIPDGVRADIAAARRAAVAEMDNERRAVERDLHDGAQHHLVSLRLTLGLVEHEVATGSVGSARDRLAVLADQVGAAELVLAETAAGMSPAVLVARGLGAALGAELNGGGMSAAVDVEDRRFPAEVEAAVYFCCLEAVGNARKHAPDAAVTVRLRCVGGVLSFSVSDDGPGFAATDSSGGGRGLANMSARITGVGGDVEISSARGSGTTVTGTVPLMPA